MSASQQDEGYKIGSWELKLYFALVTGDLETVKDIAKDHDISELKFSMKCFAESCTCGHSYELDGPGLTDRPTGESYELLQEGHCYCVLSSRLSCDSSALSDLTTASLTVLHAGIKSAYPELVRYLLDDVGCSATAITDFSCCNGLHIAMQLLSNALYSVLSEALFEPPADVLVQRASLLKDNLMPIVRLLVEHGCDINLRNKSEPSTMLKGNTPLSTACLKQFDDDVLNLLVELGADVNLPTHSGESLLHRAVRKKHGGTVEALLRGDCKDVNSPFPIPDAYEWPYSMTEMMPLIHAAMKGDAVIVKMLLHHGADPDNFNEEIDMTPLMCCAATNYLDVATVLLQHGCDVNKSSKHGYRTLHSAAWNGFTHLCELLLKYGASHDDQTEDKNTQLSLACHGNHQDVVELFLERHCDVNNADKDSDTSMHYAAFHGATRIVEKLLERGAKVDPANSACATPMWNAVYRQHEQLARLLLQHGVNIEVKSRGIDQLAETNHVSYCYPEEKSLLFVACDKRSYDVVKWLILAGYNPYQERWFTENNYPSALSIYPELVEWMQKTASTPLSLLRLSRSKVRSLLGTKLLKSVSHLEIPETLQGFLTMKEL